jgi:hypothetical protein
MPSGEILPEARTVATGVRPGSGDIARKIHANPEANLLIHGKYIV